MAQPFSFSDSEALTSYLSRGVTKPKAKPKEESFLEATGRIAGDVVPSFGEGASSLVQGVGTFFGGSDSAVAELGRSGVEYWNERKSEKLKAEEAELSRMMQDENESIFDVAAKVGTSPTLIVSMLSSSAPSMVVGMGAGGLIAKGMASAGIMASNGILTSMGARVAGGVGEGLTLVPEVYSNTQGNTEAGLAAIALGVGTSIVTPGNVSAAAARKIAGGAEETTVTAFNRSAARRAGTAVLGEGSQEFVQEGGQALLEQVGTRKEDGSLGDLDWAAAGKQAAVGAVLGGVMGGGLHPVVGEGDPLKAKIIAQERALADRRAAAEADPNNPVLAAEVAKSATELDITRVEAAVETTPKGATREQLQKELEKKKLELTAKEARVAAERDPGNQNLQDAATTAEGAVIVALAEGDKSVISNAASRAVSASAQGVMQADNVDSMITTFSTGNHASEVLRTATAGVTRTAEGVDQAIDEAFEADVEAGVQLEEFTQEQMQAKALKAEIESLRLRQQQAKTQQAETKLEREVETLRAQQNPLNQTEVQQKPEKKLETIEMIEPVGGEVSSDVMIREQAKAIPGGSFMVEESMDFPGQFDVITPDGQVYDSYTNQQDADATAYRFNGLLDKEYARQQIARPDDFELDEARREIGSISNQLDGVLSFDPDGYPSEIEDALRVLDRGSNTSPREMHSALNVMSAYVNTAYRTGLMGPNGRETVRRFGDLNARAVDRIRKLMAAEQPEVEEVKEITATEAAEPTQRLESDSLDRLSNAVRLATDARFFGNVTDRAVQGAVDQLINTDELTEPSRLESALGVLDAWGNSNLRSVDNRVWQITSRDVRRDILPVLQSRSAARPNIADEIRALAAEVEVETAPAARAARPRTEEGVRVVEQDFTRRAENAKRDGTLDKLSQFWRKIMRSKGQRTLPKIKMDDLVRPARTALARGEKLPQRVLTQIQDRYNAALKENARKWATENNQRFDESQWVDPIQGIIAYNDGASTPGPQNAGFSVELFPLNRGAGKNPYMVPAGARSANFSAGYSIHAVSIQNAKGAADLGYRLAAEIANLRGVPFPSDSVLLTVNNLRRQLQSMSSDTLFAPGTISPLTRSREGAGQGISATTWANMTDDQRIGLNALRAAHTISENRGQQGGIKTAARFIENLAYDRQGRIIAYRDPRTQNGFPRGTVVTDAMLDAKIGQIDPVTGIEPFQADEDHQGGVGLSTAKLGILNNTILREIEGNPEATIPTWVETVAKREGRKMSGWFFSETDTQAGGIDRDFATSAMNEMLGDTVTKILLDSGVVTFVDSQEDLTGNTFSDAAGNIQGATTPDGRIVLVLENLNPRSFSAVLQHEGLHSTLKALVGEKTYSGMMSRLETLVQAGQGSDWANKAAAAVPSNTLPENRNEEIAGYALEQYVKGEPETNPLVKWAKEFMSALRAGILKSKLMPEAVKLWAMKNLQPQDLSKLALAGLRQRAQRANLISRANGVRPSVAEAAAPLRTAAQYQEEIDSLMAEHAMPETTRTRRAEINREVAQLRTAWRVADEAEFARDRGLRLSVEEEVAVGTEPVAPPVPNEFNVLNLGARNPLARFVERLEKTLVDKHATINRIQRLAGITSEQIKLDTMGALDRLGSRLMTKQEDLVMKPLARMENLLNQAGWDGDSGREALDELLKAKHVAEYNAHIAEINPARYDDKGEYQGGYDAEHPGSGITDADAEATIKRLTSGDDAKTKALLEANDIYRQMIRDLQDYAVEQGLETQETIDNWNKKFPNYTPFNRDLNLSEDPSFGTVPGGQGFSLRAGLSRRAMGSSARIVSPLASTVLFGLKTTTRGENAEVGRTMLNFAREFTPKFRDENKEWKPMFKVNTVQTQRVVKYVNVYQVTKADGSLSREYYNREQARSFADAQQALWVATNPNADPNTSGIGVQRIGDGPQARVVVQPIPNQLNQDNVMVIPENGKNVVIEFDKQSEDAMRVLAAFKGATTSKELNRMLMVPRMFSRWVQATATGFNPVFALFNSVRDIQSAMVTVGADKIPGWTAADSAEIALLFPKAAAQIWRQQGKEFRALHSNEAIDTTPEAGSFAEWQQDAAKHGGITGVRSSIFDAEDAETQIRRLFGQKMLDKYRSVNEASDWGSVAGGIAVKVGDAFARFGEGETSAPVLGWVSKNLVSATARMNEATELATRTVVFKKAVEKYEAAGKSPEEARTLAANISKNVSTNFNRRGAWSSTMNQLWPFFNAAMQGTARVAETLFEKQTYSVSKDGVVALDEKTKLSGYGKAVIASLATLGGLQAAVLALAGFEDDEPPQHVRDRNFIIPLFNGKGDYLMIPMPHGLNTMINFGRDMTQAMINPKKAGEHVANALWQLPNFNPFGSAGNVATDLAPAVIDPFLALWMNEDAFGRPIAKEDRDAGNPTPGFTRAKEGASSLGRTLARGLNMLSGGNDDRKGFLSPTPDQIDFVMGQVTGGVGREIGKVALVAGQAVDTAAGRETEALPSYKKPLIGRLVSSTQEPTAIRSKVFDIRQEINQTYAEYKGMRDRREVEEAREFWNAHPELKLRDDFERAAKQDSKMRKSRAVARNAGEISSVNKMTNQQDERLLKLVGRYKELKGD